jgi:hypothetical protein
VPRAQVLHVALGALDLRGRGGRPERLDAGGLEPVDQAQHQRPLGPDHDQVDRLLHGEPHQAVDVVGGDGDAFGLALDPGVAGRAEEPVAQRRGRDRPAQRVLPSARADHQNLHVSSLPLLPPAGAGVVS